MSFLCVGIVPTRVGGQVGGGPAAAQWGHPSVGEPTSFHCSLLEATAGTAAAASEASLFLSNASLRGISLWSGSPFLIQKKMKALERLQKPPYGQLWVEDKRGTLGKGLILLALCLKDSASWALLFGLQNPTASSLPHSGLAERL